ncbi:MAG: FKBP-type peptidyl-prolyl cis-trans isomerase [Bacteroidales bacterium]|nr:FKBP-type peptidyl-prolyl cis-trans isomerase [Bacteroidales bacterium]
MIKLQKFIAISAIALLLCSCNNDSVFPGFIQMENGAYMKFYSKGDSEVAPRLHDGVTVGMAQYFDDSLLFSTSGQQPIYFELEEADFVGDVSDALLMMHVGDSARLAVLADSVFQTMMGMEAPAEYVGKPIYYDLKLISVKPFDEIEAEHKALLDSLKTEEQNILEPFRNDPNSRLTESGLIVLSQSGKGRVAEKDEFVNFDFCLSTLDDDTIMCSYGVEPVDFQVGSLAFDKEEVFICKGFTETLGMVAKGGTIQFIIPSALGFDSTGYEQMILPYTPLKAKVMVHEILSKEQYDKKIEEQEKQRQAEAERMMALEETMISDYVEKNGITETPTESGLYIINEEEGSGEMAQWGETVKVHYIIHNLKGDFVESSYDYEPLPFTIGQGEMILAIEEAVMTMNKGAKVRLISPSKLAFGEYVIDEELLPAYSPMVIDLELVEIVK